MLKKVALRAAELGVQVGASVIISHIVSNVFDRIREDYMK